MFGRADEPAADLVAIGVGNAARPVVEIVELADDRVAGDHHFGERRGRQGLERVRLEGGGELVHPLAPRPERAAVSGFGRAGHGGSE